MAEDVVRAGCPIKPLSLPDEEKAKLQVIAKLSALGGNGFALEV